MGVMSLTNLSLGAGFTVPFIGQPLSVRFNFCTREAPFNLTVSSLRRWRLLRHLHRPARCAKTRSQLRVRRGHRHRLRRGQRRRARHGRHLFQDGARQGLAHRLLPPRRLCGCAGADLGVHRAVHGPHLHLRGRQVHRARQPDHRSACAVLLGQRVDLVRAQVRRLQRRPVVSPP